MIGRWSWSDALIFIGVISALQITLFVLLTKVFFGMFPEGEQCPMCDGDTIAVERVGWWRLFARRFRRSWCLDCGWEGVLRRSDAWMRKTRTGWRTTWRTAERTS